MNSRIGFGRTVDAPFEQTVERVTAELEKEGFGILTQIDVAATLKKKLGIDTPAYRILGACNPGFAHKALEMAPEIGLLLPCNVVVRDDRGTVRVEFMNPEGVLGLADRPDMAPLASQVRQCMQRVCDAL